MTERLTQLRLANEFLRGNGIVTIGESDGEIGLLYTYNYSVVAYWWESYAHGFVITDKCPKFLDKTVERLNQIFNLPNHEEP